MSGTLVGALELCSDVLDPWVAVEADRSLAGDLPGVLSASVVLREQLEIVRLRTLAAYDAEQLGPRHGVPNAAAHWSLLAGEDRATSRRDAAVGRRLFHEDLTDTGAAMVAGVISSGQARAIHRSTTRMLPEDVAALQQILLAHPRLAPEHIEDLAARARQLIEDRTAQEQRAARTQAARSFTMARVGDGLHVEGFIIGVAAEVLEAQITAGSKPAPLPDGSRDPRTSAQRRHDAFSDLVLAAAAAPEDLPAASPALATVMLTSEDLRAFAGPFVELTPQQRAKGEACCGASRTWVAVHHPGPVADPPPDPPWVRRRLATPYPPKTYNDPQTAAVIRHALTHLAPAFGGIPTEVLDLGRTERDFNRAQRRALGHRDGGCVVGGCPKTPRECRAHHLQWWDRDHGPTDLFSAALVCTFHHHLIHDQGWTLVHNPDGTWTFSPPTDPASPSPGR